jgi:hypothetical protein
VNPYPGEPFVRTSGNELVHEAYEGCFSRQGVSASQTGEAGRRLIETLGRRWIRRAVAVSAKRVRGVRVKVRARSSAASPGRHKPKGASSGWRTNHSPAGRDSRKGQDPGTAARLSRPVASAAGTSAGGTVGGSIRAVIPSDTFREEKAPKGESHERCRCETEPARDRRA